MSQNDKVSKTFKMLKCVVIIFKIGYIILNIVDNCIYNDGKERIGNTILKFFYNVKTNAKFDDVKICCLKFEI